MLAYQDIQLQDIVQQLLAISDTRMSQLVILLGIVLAIMYFWASRGARRRDDALLDLIGRQQRLLEKFEQQMEEERDHDAVAQAATRALVERVTGEIRAAIVSLSEAIAGMGATAGQQYRALERSLITLDGHMTSLQQQGSEPLRQMAARLLEVQALAGEIKRQIEGNGGELERMGANLRQLVKELEIIKGDVSLIQRTLGYALKEAREQIKSRTGENPVVKDE